MKRTSKIILWIALSPVLLLVWAWSLGAFYYMSGGSRSGFASYVPLAIGVTTVIVLLRFRRQFLWWVLGLWAAAMVWILAVQPSNDRQWPPELARMPSAEFDGDKVTVRNIRNFNYRSTDDFDVAYYDKTFDLNRLDTADLVMCYWDGNTRIAHTMLSFGFGGRDYVCLSVETRREDDEAWGGLPGIYKQFEILYILGDERDLVNLRTSYRKEDLFLYRLQVPRVEIREYFVHALERMNELIAKPEFYDTLEYNCSSALTRMGEELWPDRPRQTGLANLLNGSTAMNAYNRGTIVSTLPFEELKRRSYITPVGQQHRDAADFSQKLREGLPR